MIRLYKTMLPPRQGTHTKITRRMKIRTLKTLKLHYRSHRPSERLEINCSRKERPRKPYKSIKVSTLLYWSSIAWTLTELWYEESLRYLDVHPVLPEGSSQELQDRFNALITPLLLNSALAAIRAQPPSSANSSIAISNTTRALDKLTLSDADKGTIHSKHRKHNIGWTPF